MSRGFLAGSGQDLDAVVGHGVVRRRDHDTGVEPARGQERHSRRRQNTDADGFPSGGPYAAHQAPFDPFPGLARIAPDDDAGRSARLLGQRSAEADDCRRVEGEAPRRAAHAVRSEQDRRHGRMRPAPDRRLAAPLGAQPTLREPAHPAEATPLGDADSYRRSPGGCAIGPGATSTVTSTERGPHQSKQRIRDGDGDRRAHPRRRARDRDRLGHRLHDLREPALGPHHLDLVRHRRDARHHETGRRSAVDLRRDRHGPGRPGSFEPDRDRRRHDARHLDAEGDLQPAGGEHVEEAAGTGMLVREVEDGHDVARCQAAHDARRAADAHRDRLRHFHELEARRHVLDAEGNVEVALHDRLAGDAQPEGDGQHERQKLEGEIAQQGPGHHISYSGRSRR